MNAATFFRQRILRREFYEIVPWLVWLLVCIVVLPGKLAPAIALLGGFYASSVGERVAGEPAREGNWEFLLTRSVDRDHWFGAHLRAGLIPVLAFCALGLLVAFTDFAAYVDAWLAPPYPGAEFPQVSGSLALVVSVFPILVYADSFYSALSRVESVPTSGARLNSILRSGLLLAVAAMLIGLVVSLGIPSPGSRVAERVRELGTLGLGVALTCGALLAAAVYVRMGRGSLRTLEITGAGGAAAGSASGRATGSSAVVVLGIVLIVMMIVALVLSWAVPMPAGGVPK